MQNNTHLLSVLLIFRIKPLILWVCDVKQGFLKMLETED